MTKKGAQVSHLSQYDQEQEILIPAGEKFLVLDKKIDDEGKAYIFITDN